MDDFGIFNPHFVRRLREDWERTTAEVRRATAPILNEAERIIGGAFRPPAKGPTTPLDGCDWQRVAEMRRRCASDWRRRSPTCRWCGSTRSPSTALAIRRPLSRCGQC